MPTQKSSVNGNPWFSFRRLSLLALLMMLIAGCANTPALQNHFLLSDLVPNGKTTVEVVEIRFSERVEELALKMNSEIATNQDWWMEYLKQHINDHPLPYHSNFGLTKKEYAEYLDGADKTRHLHKVSDAYVTFGHQGGQISMDLGDENSPVNKWRLNASTGELLLPNGKAIKPVWISSGDTTQPLGAFEGYKWNYETPDESLSNFNTASLQIYRQKPSGMIFWRVQEGEIQNNRSVRSLDIAFRYDQSCVKCKSK